MSTKPLQISFLPLGTQRAIVDKLENPMLNLYIQNWIADHISFLLAIVFIFKINF